MEKKSAKSIHCVRCIAFLLVTLCCASCAKQWTRGDFDPSVFSADRASCEDQARIAYPERLQQRIRFEEISPGYTSCENEKFQYNCVSVPPTTVPVTEEYDANRRARLRAVDDCLRGLGYYKE